MTNTTKKMLLSVLGLILIAALVLCLRVPQPQGDWVNNQIRLPKVVIENAQVTIEGVRDFIYKNDGEVEQARYLSKTYNINSVKRVWYGLSHFSDHGLAHAFLSFEFEDGEYLVSSIEARVEKGKQYRPLKGLLPVYSRIMVLGTERDVIALRSHYRKEHVLLYPVKLKSSHAQALFKVVMQDAINIEKHPDFYNTLFDNCITGILQYENRWSNYFKRFDLRVILPGYSDKLLHEHGFIGEEGGLKELRVRAQIDAGQVEVSGDKFSQQIRAGWQEAIAVDISDQGP